MKFKGDRGDLEVRGDNVKLQVDRACSNYELLQSI